MTAQETSRPLIFSDEIYALVRYSGQQLRRLEEKGDFPRRIRLGANRVAWSRVAVDQWIADRLGAR